MSVLCPICGSAHVARDFDNDTKIDIAFTCHTCGMEYSVPTIHEIERESIYDVNKYNGPVVDVIPSDPADERQQ